MPPLRDFWYLYVAFFAYIFLMFMTFKSSAEGLPSFVTARARAACESDVRRICVKGSKPSYEQIRNCVENNFKRMNNQCQYEIVSLLPEIEKYEKRRNK